MRVCAQERKCVDVISSNGFWYNSDVDGVLLLPFPVLVAFKILQRIVYEKSSNARI
jgi:hypothetical protein